MSDLVGIRCDACGQEEKEVRGAKPSGSVWIRVKDFWIGGVRQLSGDYCSVSCFFKVCSREALEKAYEEAAQEVAEVTKQ